MVGNVRHPGAFRLEDSTGLSVLKALALAEGLTPFSTKDAYIVRRTDGSTGRRQRKPPFLCARFWIVTSRTCNWKLDDILYIPDNRRGHTTASIVERAISFAAGTASGALVLGVNR